MMLEDDRAPLPERGDTPAPGHACQVFRAQDVVVRSGVNRGDPLGGPEDLCPGDIYHLAPAASPMRLVIRPGAAGDGQVIAAGSEVGAPGQPVRVTARLTLMTADGDRVELLVLRHDTGDGAVDYALPLSPMAPRGDYELIQVGTEPGEVRLADLVCTSFVRGTTVTLAEGQQVAVEDLRPGDRLLTRDHGGQTLRWIGRAHV